MPHNVLIVLNYHLLKPKTIGHTICISAISAFISRWPASDDVFVTVGSSESFDAAAKLLPSSKPQDKTLPDWITPYRSNLVGDRKYPNQICKSVKRAATRQRKFATPMFWELPSFGNYSKILNQAFFCLVWCQVINMD